MTNCPECGSAAPDSFGKCPTCDANLNNLEVSGATEPCTHCGERISSDDDACPACGVLRERRACDQHSDRDARGQCVLCGDALCADCNRGGDAHFLCEEHRSVPVVQGWAQVYTTSDDLEAQLIRDNLQAEGVDSRVLSQKDHFAIPVDMGDLSPVRVLVPAYSYGEALDMIADHMDARGEVRFGDEEALPQA